MDASATSGIEASTGSLGQGLSIGLGMALAARLTKKDYRVYVLLGDGECQEGQVWEAAMAAGHHRPDNLIAIIDFNKFQLDGATADIIGLEPLAVGAPEVQRRAALVVVLDPGVVELDLQVRPALRVDRDREVVEASGAELVVDDVAMGDGTARHDPHKLASAYARILAEGD